MHSDHDDGLLAILATAIFVVGATFVASPSRARLCRWLSRLSPLSLYPWLSLPIPPPSLKTPTLEGWTNEH